MPRASDYLLAGYTYHLTHKCHNGSFLLKFVKDRDTYLRWLREGVRRYRVPVYGFCITSNHVHILAHAETKESIGNLMRLAAGSLAKNYNTRKRRLGSMWQHPYDCTIVENGRHLRNCLLYISLNMVRAGVVSHPEQWRWCSHDELVGKRQRYCLLDLDRLTERLGLEEFSQVQTWYKEALILKLQEGRMQREPFWTDSLAVGSPAFVEEMTRAFASRRQLAVEARSESAEGVWTLREMPERYG